MSATTVRVIECDTPDELHRQYDGEMQPQPCYIELDLREGTLLADWNAEVGNAVPESVYHGFERRYRIPCLTADAANRVMNEIAPLAGRVVAGFEEEWDGKNMVARLSDDAQNAEDEIETRLGNPTEAGFSDEPNQAFDESDLVAVWDVDGATTGDEVNEYGITATTTDARLTEIEAQIVKEIAEVSGSGVAIVPGLDEYLIDLRNELADDDPLTDAELRTTRERLGLTGDRLSSILGVNPRTLRSWEQGRDPVPGRVRPEMVELTEAADKAVALLVASIEGVDEPELLTYRSDDEYKAALAAGQLSALPQSYRWCAAWHRQVCARAGARTAARIVYGDTEASE